MENRAKELANQHWGYIEQVLKTSGVQEQEIERIGFHYTTSMIHGYGHGVEDAINSTKKCQCNDVSSTKGE